MIKTKLAQEIFESEGYEVNQIVIKPSLNRKVWLADVTKNGVQTKKMLKVLEPRGSKFLYFWMKVFLFWMGWGVKDFHSQNAIKNEMTAYEKYTSVGIDMAKVECKNNYLIQDFVEGITLKEFLDSGQHKPELLKQIFHLKGQQVGLQYKVGPNLDDRSKNTMMVREKGRFKLIPIDCEMMTTDRSTRSLMTQMYTFWKSPTVARKFDHYIPDYVRGFIDTTVVNPTQEDYAQLEKELHRYIRGGITYSVCVFLELLEKFVNPLKDRILAL